jgi:hypothetical protein
MVPGLNQSRVRQSGWAYYGLLNGMAFRRRIESDKIQQLLVIKPVTVTASKVRLESLVDHVQLRHF